MDSIIVPCPFQEDDNEGLEWRESSEGVNLDTF